MFNIDSFISISKIPSIALDVIIIIIITIGLSGDGGGGSQPHTKRVAKCISGRLTFAVRAFFPFQFKFHFHFNCQSTARPHQNLRAVLTMVWFGLRVEAISIRDRVQLPAFFHPWPEGEQCFIMKI